MQLTIVCPTNDEEVLEANLLKSKVIKTKQCPVLLFKDPKNVMEALNEGKMVAKTTHVAFIHQDVLLPDSWYLTVMQALTRITQIDSNFGTLGVAGMHGDKLIGHVKDRGKPWGTPIGLPRVADTLDELLLITRKDNVWFDESLPSVHLYGADICIQYRLRDLRNYAINAYCYHNSTLPRKLPDDFKAAQDYVRKKYLLIRPEYNIFPIRTTCTRIEKVEKKETKEPKAK